MGGRYRECLYECNCIFFLSFRDKTKAWQSVIWTRVFVTCAHSLKDCRRMTSNVWKTFWILVVSSLFRGSEKQWKVILTEKVQMRDCTLYYTLPLSFLFCFVLLQVVWDVAHLDLMMPIISIKNSLHVCTIFSGLGLCTRLHRRAQKCIRVNSHWLCGHYYRCRGSWA